MEPKFETLAEKLFVGKRLTTSFSEDKTYELWSAFMPRRNEVGNAAGTSLYSIEVYPPLFFDHFNANTTFEKWAAAEVTNFNSVPGEMDTLVSPQGLYAVFLHVGPASTGPITYQYIFANWLPNSAYTIDNRPHFAIMGEKYKHDDPAAEEEIWIPVKPNINM